MRITHSGAGCGAHWPLCDGEIILGAIDREAHRVHPPADQRTVRRLWVDPNGLELGDALVTAPRDHRRRVTLFFIIVEETIGAGCLAENRRR